MTPEEFDRNLEGEDVHVVASHCMLMSHTSPTNGRRLEEKTFTWRATDLPMVRRGLHR